MYKHILVLFQICQHWLVLGIVDVNHLDWTENLNQSYKSGLYKWEYDLIKLSGWSITTVSHGMQSSDLDNQ